MPAPMMIVSYMRKGEGGVRKGEGIRHAISIPPSPLPLPPSDQTFSRSMSFISGSR